MMTREEMMRDVSRKYGFYDERVIGFCFLCEDDTSDSFVELAYKALMSK